MDPSLRRIRSQVVETAKQAARDAVSDFSGLTPYTIGIAVEAALAVFMSALETGAPDIIGIRHGRPGSVDVDSWELPEAS